MNASARLELLSLNTVFIQLMTSWFKSKYTSLHENDGSNQIKLGKLRRIAKLVIKW